MFPSHHCTENIAHLAESALRFLELVQENNVNTEHDTSGEDTEGTLHPNENYDSGTHTEHSDCFGLFSINMTPCARVHA